MARSLPIYIDVVQVGELGFEQLILLDPSDPRRIAAVQGISSSFQTQVWGMYAARNSSKEELIIGAEKVWQYRPPSGFDQRASFQMWLNRLKGLPGYEGDPWPTERMDDPAVRQWKMQYAETMVRSLV